MANHNPNNKEVSNDAKLVGTMMREYFTLAKQSKKDHPNKWTKEKRTSYNEEKKMVQYLYDNASFSAAQKRLEYLDEEFHLTGRKYDHASKGAKKKNERNDRT